MRVFSSPTGFTPDGGVNRTSENGLPNQIIQTPANAFVSEKSPMEDDDARPSRQAARFVHAECPGPELDR